MRNTFSKSVPYRTKHLRVWANGPEGVTARQEKLAGFNREALASAKVILIGAGDLGGEIGEALLRKGVGILIIFDNDFVELTNLNRQKSYRRDLYKNKAVRLAKNLAREGFCDTLIQGYGLCFEEAIERGFDLHGSVAIVGVDNNPGRVAVSRYYRQLATPVIFTAVSRTANNGYVFVQEPTGPCFGCIFPDAVNDETYPCPGTPAVKDILKVVAGIVVYAVDSLLMERLRLWNYKDEYLDGSIPGRALTIARREDCVLCRSQQDESQGAN